VGSAEANVGDVAGSAVAGATEAAAELTEAVELTIDAADSGAGAADEASATVLRTISTMASRRPIPSQPFRGVATTLITTWSRRLLSAVNPAAIAASSVLPV